MHTVVWPRTQHVVFNISGIKTQPFFYILWDQEILMSFMYSPTFLHYLKSKVKNSMPTISFSTISVQFSCSVMSYSLCTHGLQHARPPCPSPTSGVYPNSCPLSQWCHPAISSSVIPFTSCPQSFPASGSFPMSQLFASGGSSIEVSASASVLAINTQDWSPLGWTCWSPCSPRDSQKSSPTPQFKNLNSSALSFLCSPTLTSIHDHWKNHSLD